MNDRSAREPFEIVPIRRIDVYKVLLNQLDALVRSLEPGDRLPPERELVERSGVSRVSVREALRALESMGKIEIRRNAGSFVLQPDGDPFAARLRSIIPVDEQFLDYLVDVRAAIEDKVVEIVGLTATGENLDEIAALLDLVAQELDDDEHDLGSLDLRFEALMARIAGNPILSEVQRSIHQLWVQSWAQCGITPGDRAGLYREHLEILEALRTGDTTEARRIMGEHVNRTVGEGASEPPMS